MKKALLPLILIILTLNSFSQNNSLKKYMPTEDGWLLDTTIVFNEYNLGFSYKTRILNRNEFSFPLFEEFSKYNSETEQYEMISSYTYSYPNNQDTNEYYLIFSYEPDSYNDSIRLYYNYNDNGYYIESEEYWNQGQWGYGTMTKQKLNQNYPIFEVIELRRLNENEDWNISEERKSFYNIDSTILTSFVLQYGETNDTIRKSITYNDFENNTSIRKIYTEIDGSLQQYAQIEMQLNNNNQATEVIEYEIEEGEFTNDRMYYFQYDSNDFLSLKEEYEWDKNDSIWEYEEKISYENDSNGNILEEIKFDDIEDSLWVTKYKWTYSYNQDNRILSEEKWRMNEDSTWEKSALDTYTYHEGLQSSFLHQVWADSLNAYWDHYKDERDYDEHNRITEYRHYSTSNSQNQFLLMFTYYYFYLESENQFIKEMINIDEFTLDTISYEIDYYNKYSTSINELSKTEFAIYPNPTTDFISLDSDTYKTQNLEYEIYSSIGKLIIKDKLKYKQNIDTSHLPNGQYLIKILKPNGKTETHKFQKI